MKNLLLLAAICGCTAGVKPSQTSNGGSSATGLAGNDSGGSGITGAAGSFGNTGGTGSLPDASIGGDAACATEMVNAQPVPLDLYVLMDSSKSMLETMTAGL